MDATSSREEEYLRLFAQRLLRDLQVPEHMLVAGMSMEHELVAALPDMSALDAISLLREKQIDCLPVVNADGRLIGMRSTDAPFSLAATLLVQRLRV